MDRSFMPRPLQRAIENLKKEILALSAVVEERFREGLKAFHERDASRARKVIQRDAEIDEREVDIEERCLQILALYQPVAVDLRTIIAILKINNDLERIGDLAVNIAEHALYFSERGKVETGLDLAPMEARVREMLKQALDAFIEWDVDLAYRVCASDDEVDRGHRNAYATVEREIRQNPDRAEGLIHLLGISRYLERIADHATNIAEDVIYLVEGEIKRHRVDEGP